MAMSSSAYHVSFDQNKDGTWTAWIGSNSFDGTKDECLKWIKSEDPAYNRDAKEPAEPKAAR